jgi:hypothetical protein
MRQLMIQDRKSDGGYPLDSDLHNMTDDGCPLVPDPARWADADWRDNLGELDTSSGPLEGPAVPADLARQPRGPTDSLRSRLLRCRICGRTEAYSPEVLLLRYVPQAWPECCGRLMGYFALQPPADVAPIHTAAA